MKKNLKNKKKGFTLIELIIVIAIIAIIAAIAMPRFGRATQDARRSSDIANAKNIANAVTMAIADGGDQDQFGENAVAVTEENLGDELQSIPVPSTGGTFFVRVIDGDVIVYTDDASGTKPIYPEGSDKVIP